MSRLEAIFMVVCGVCLLPAAMLISSWLDRSIETYRRNKYPEYYKYYNAAMKICFDSSEKVNKETEYITYHFKLITAGIRNGECTNEYARKRLNELSDLHIELTNWFKDQQAEAEKLFRQADFYAKENNLLWGVLY